MGITFVYVTHDQEEAFSMSDRVGVMHRGVLQQVGEPEEVYRRPASAFVADFVGASTGSLAPSPSRLPPLRTRSTSIAPGARSPWAARRIWRPGTGSGSSSGRKPPSSRQFRRGRPRGEARVADVSFLGPHTIYKLESEELGDLTVTASAHGVEHQPGSALRVTWPISKAWAVPMAEGGAQDSRSSRRVSQHEPGHLPRNPIRAPREPASSGPTSEATIDEHRDPGDVVRLARAEKRSRRANLVRAAEAAGRDHRRVLPPRGLGIIRERVQVLEPVGVDVSGAMQLTVTPFGPSSRERCLAHPTTGPEGVGEKQAVCRFLNRRRRHVHDTTPAAFAQRGKRVPRQADGGEHAQLVGRPRHIVEVAEVPRRRSARVVHDDVEALEPFQRLVNHPLERERVGRVSSDGERAGARKIRLDPLRLLRQFVSRRANRVTLPLARKSTRDRTTHPGRRAAHDCDASGQAEVHGGPSRPGRRRDFHCVTIVSRIASSSFGSSGQIGSACVAAFLDEGAHVGAVDLTDSILDHPRLASERADLRDVEIERSFSALESRLGPIDILVQSAAIVRRVPFLKITPANIDEIFAVDVRAVLLGARVAATSMIARGARDACIRPHVLVGGRVRSIISGLRGIQGRRQHGDQRDRDGSPSTGSAPTPSVQGSMAKAQEEERDPYDLDDYERRRIPLGRLGTGPDIADAVLFLASPASAYVTGTVLWVDGGNLASW